MIKYMPKDLSCKTKIYRNITVQDSLLFISGMLIMVLILASNLNIRFGLCIMVICVYTPLFVKMNGDRLYINLFNRIRYLISKKRYVKGKEIDHEYIYKPYKIGPYNLDNNNGTYTYLLEVIPRNISYYKQEDKERLCMCFQKVLEELEFGENLKVKKWSRLFDNSEYLLSERDKILNLVQDKKDNKISQKEYDSLLDIYEDRSVEIRRGLENRFIKGYMLELSVQDSKRGEDLIQRITSYFSSISFNTKPLTFSYIQDYIKETQKEDESSAITFGYSQVNLDTEKEIIFRCVEYPEIISECFLEDILDIDGVEVCISFEKEDKDKILKKIDGAILNLNSPSGSQRASETQKREVTEDSLYEMLESIESEDEGVLTMNILVSKILDKKDKEGRKKLKRDLNRNGFVFRECTSKMKEYFLYKRLGNVSLIKKGRVIPSGIGGCTFPFSSKDTLEENGFYIGQNESGEVYKDFFKRDTEHLNSNMVIIGKSGSGKSYCGKALITQLCAENTKVFILDPEGEYQNISRNLGGVCIDTSNGEYGRINPFEVFNKEDGYISKLRFLEEFYKTSFKGLEEEHIQKLNNLTIKMYKDKGISGETDISTLTREDYPTFENLYNECVHELDGETDTYSCSILKTILTYLERVKDTNRDGNIWNGYTTITNNERIISFNFKKLIREGNKSFANAEMLLVLHYVLSKIGEKRNKDEKVVVLVDEAHLFIDEKYPVALDFMYQLAKRIRKYNGMQIIITQNLKDFAGGEESIKKSSAIINVSQYTLLFSLSPGDITDLMKLYENAGGITEEEAQSLTYAGRGDCLFISSPREKDLIHIEALSSARLLDIEELEIDEKEE